MEPIDWQAIAEERSPATPQEPSLVALPDLEFALERAVAALDAERAPWWKRFLGIGAGLRRRLAAAVEEAASRLAAARQLNLDATAAYEAAHHAQQERDDRAELARRVLSGDLEAYREVLTGLDALQDVASVCGKQAITMTLKRSVGLVTLSIKEEEVVPRETRKVTARGKPSSAKMPETRRMEIYQDYACGSALRVGRELLAALPLEHVVVNVETPRLDPSTGHMRRVTVLSVDVPRGVDESVNWDSVDASDLVGRLRHAMKMKRGKPMEPVTPLELAEA